MSIVCFDGHVRGVSHIAKGTVCQDFSGTRVLDGARGRAIIAVVADGHGDPTCRRSERGSRIAVGVTLECLSDTARRYLDADDASWREMRSSLLIDERNAVTPVAPVVSASPAAPAELAASATSTEGEGQRAQRVGESLRPRLVRQIVDGWREEITADYKADPITDLVQAMEQSDDAWRQKAIRRIYGTTLVAVLMLPDLCILIQQGDGCATAIFADGRHHLVRSDVIPEDELCVGNVTTSLSDSDAAERMRVVALDGETDTVAALFVGTDGVDKSLPSDGGASDLFVGIALDVIDRVDKDAWDVEEFDSDLKAMMNRVSKEGSGDDVSIAGIVDINAVRRLSDALARERLVFDMRWSITTDKERLNSMQRKYEYFLALVPGNEAMARERDAYIAEYRKIEQRIASVERDLGELPPAKPLESETSVSEASEQDEEADAFAPDDVTPVLEDDADDAIEKTLIIAVDDPPEDSSLEGSGSDEVDAPSRPKPKKRHDAPTMSVEPHQSSVDRKRTVMVILIVVLSLVLVGLLCFLALRSCGESKQVEEKVPAEPVTTESSATDSSATDSSATDSSATEREVPPPKPMPSEVEIRQVVSDAFDEAFSTENDNEDFKKVQRVYPEELNRLLDAYKRAVTREPFSVSASDASCHATINYSCVTSKNALNQYANDGEADTASELLEYMTEKLQDETYCKTNRADGQQADVYLEQNGNNEWELSKDSRQSLMNGLKHYSEFNVVMNEVARLIKADEAADAGESAMSEETEAGDATATGRAEAGDATDGGSELSITYNTRGTRINA